MMRNSAAWPAEPRAPMRRARQQHHGRRAALNLCGIALAYRSQLRDGGSMRNYRRMPTAASQRCPPGWTSGVKSTRRAAATRAPLATLRHSGTAEAGHGVVGGASGGGWRVATAGDGHSGWRVATAGDAHSGWRMATAGNGSVGWRERRVAGASGGGNVGWRERRVAGTSGGGSGVLVEGFDPSEQHYDDRAGQVQRALQVIAGQKPAQHQPTQHCPHFAGFLLRHLVRRDFHFRRVRADALRDFEQHALPRAREVVRRAHHPRFEPPFTHHRKFHRPEVRPPKTHRPKFARPMPCQSRPAWPRLRPGSP
jgi:hypothetical protein